VSDSSGEERVACCPLLQVAEEPLPLKLNRTALREAPQLQLELHPLACRLGKVGRQALVVFALQKPFAQASVNGQDRNIGRRRGQTVTTKEATNTATVSSLCC
jgi:hypothetical protein